MTVESILDNLGIIIDKLKGLVERLRVEVKVVEVNRYECKPYEI